MKLRNSTSIPDSFVREVVDFTRPSGVHHVDVYLENRSWGHASGRANHGYVTVRIQEDAAYPFHWTPSTGGYCFTDWVRSKEEALVVLLAHEMRHQWQFGVGQSFNESLRRNRKQGFIHYDATKVVHDFALPETTTVTRGHTTYSRAKVVKVRKVRRVGHARRRGQKGGAERDADVYAQTRLRAWRVAHPVEPCWEAAEGPEQFPLDAPTPEVRQ